ncbi:hypothetical protein BJY00DRAFT_312382 [Aspergillus carlsbadensis]|nr:hypothetical protein BJY00DRAFT_312382 [Aspergillus carlsbadensis]
METWETTLPPTHLTIAVADLGTILAATEPFTSFSYATSQKPSQTLSFSPTASPTVPRALSDPSPSPVLTSIFCIRVPLVIVITSIVCMIRPWAITIGHRPTPILSVIETAAASFGGSLRVIREVGAAMDAQ